MARKEEVEAVGDPMAVMMVSLNLILLIFFVYLNSIGTDDEERIKKALGSLAGQFGMLPSGLQITKGDKLLLPGPSFVTPGEVKVDFGKEFRKIIDAGLLLPEEVNVVRNGREMIINLADKVLFSSGRAELLPRAEEILAHISRNIRKNGKPVTIEGHTDDLPIATVRYPSNWELSAARATSVLRFFVEKSKVNPDLLTAVGYAGYRPLVPNQSREGRARNRRVRIVIDLGRG